VTDVFVSYKRENLAAVGRLVAALRAEGVGVWWDQDIAPNAAWEATIEAALAAAKLVIVAWSPAAVASENVKAEARWARQQGRLLQVFVEACAPPLFFGERQGVDLKGWSGGATDLGFRAVLEAVRSGLSQPPAPSSDDAAAPPVVADPPPPLPSKPSIAVLPFANLSGDPEQEYFADGMVEEIANALSRIKSIFVIAGSSTLSFRGKDVSAQEIARLLGVRFVLEGSVRKAANRVRIAVRLIDAAGGAQIWSERFEDTLEDVFALQDKVALATAGQIGPTVQEAEIRRASAPTTTSVGSYDLYLRAYPLLRAYTKTSVLEALDLLDRAIALDPDHGMALSHAMLCEYLISLYGWSAEPELSRRKAIDLAHRALNVARDDAHVISLAAVVVGILEADWDTAFALVDRAVALNPGSATAWLASSQVRLRTGLADLAAEHIETAIRLDPLGPDRPAYTMLLGAARFCQKRFGEAAALEKQAGQQSEGPMIRAVLAASYGHLGRLTEAQEALAAYRSQTQAPIEDFASNFFRDEAHLKLFLDGIALAEGAAP
jgi:adenylate cyclase